MAGPLDAKTWAGIASHTAPLPTMSHEGSRIALSPRNIKRPRVSFANVATRTFSPGCEDPRKLSSPQERVLSPIADASRSSERQAQPTHVYNEENTTEELHFPTVRDLVATPPENPKGNRSSMSSEISEVQKQAAAAAASASRVAENMLAGRSTGHSDLGTPLRHRDEDPAQRDAPNSANSGGSHDSGEVTANIASYTDLISQDEKETKKSVQPSPPLENLVSTTRPVSGRRTPTTENRSPNIEEATDTSPLPATWDLYEKFKTDRGGASFVKAPRKTGNQDGATKQGQSGAGKSPPTTLGRGRSPDTVDMGPVVQHLAAGRREFAGVDEEDYEVPEARKSFGKEGANASERHSLGNVPTPSRANSRSAPYEKSSPNSKVSQKGTAVRSPLKSAASPARVRGFASPQSFGAFQNRRSQERERRSTRASSAVGEGDSLLYSPTGESALPGVSYLQPVQTMSSFADCSMSDTGARLAWDEFLSHCGVHWDTGPMDQLAQADVDMPQAAAPSRGCPRSQKAADVLSQKQADCLQKAVKALAERNETVLQQYNRAVQHWNQSPIMPPSAAELYKVMESPQELEILRNRIKAWQVHCKEEAWLKWWTIKQELLRKDLDAAREGTAGLKADLHALKEASRRLQETSKKARATLRQQHHRSDMQQTAAKLRQQSEEEQFQAEEDRQLMLRKAPEAEAQLEAERKIVAELEQKLEEHRQAEEQSKSNLKEAKRNLLAQRARRVELEQQHCARTCMVTKATATRYELTLRGGARAFIAKSPRGNDGMVQVTFQTPESCALPDSFSELSRELFVAAWRDCIVAVQDDQVAEALDRGTPMEVTVSQEEVRGIVQRLDVGALRVQDQLAAIKNLRESCPDVIDIQARARECDSSGSLVVDAAITVLFSHSHTVNAGPGGIAPIMPGERAVDATKFTVEFSSDLPSFPNSVEWSDAVIQKAFGRHKVVESAKQALLNLNGAGLEEALGAVAEAARHSAPCR
eukprot:TRINITY_DN47793_c0_g1_i1.p1 TRINITY_DN47793_c0_g1~~TRINITY_DN47793_c0_g1_i1.p1  ORF type:complete len:988 (-),score=227.08 TRINITY_DN47793_c0_g1_i1:218-3181(-)